MSGRAEIERVLDAKATLGEGTFWDTREQVLWWVNIWRRESHRFHPATGLDRV
jgi:L-arabinonolactonase